MGKLQTVSKVVIMKTVKFWKTVSFIAGFLLIVQYGYYGVKELMYQESIAALHKKTTQLDNINLEIQLLKNNVNVLEQNDRKLLSRIDSNKQMIEREIDMIEQRLPPVKPIKKVK